MTALLLWLEAPLQSWGVDSRFGRRDTLPFPSRSGVLGRDSHRFRAQFCYHTGSRSPYFHLAGRPRKQAAVFDHPGIAALPLYQLPHFF